jgi:hypothetical protein
MEDDRFKHHLHISHTLTFYVPQWHEALTLLRLSEIPAAARTPPDPRT